ncbi:MAG TPA: hypothetical protein VJY33_22190 [Isosphaeraceae bacterium]|nr:hypothetical protein [Isosphaeraceae bacterium]
MFDPNSTSPEVDSSPGRSRDKEADPVGDKEADQVSDMKPRPVSDKRRRPVSDKKTKEADDKKIKTAVHLSRDAINKLGAACVLEMKTQSQLIELLIREQLSTYSVQAHDPGRRIKFTAPSDRSKRTAEVSASAPTPS